MSHYYVAHHNEMFSGMLVARLQAAFGPGSVAHTHMRLEPGMDARKAAAKYAASAEIILVVIGTDWVNRISQPDDFARIATTYALKYQRRVVPVLINGALLPDAALLPESLRKVVYLSPYAVNDVENDIVRLIASLQRSQQSQQHAMQQPDQRPISSVPRPSTPLGWLLWPFRLVWWVFASIIKSLGWLAKTIVQQALKSIISLIVTLIVFGLVGALVVWFVSNLLQNNMDAAQALATMADSIREMFNTLSNIQSVIPTTTP